MRTSEEALRHSLAVGDMKAAADLVARLRSRAIQVVLGALLESGDLQSAARYWAEVSPTMPVDDLLTIIEAINSDEAHHVS